MKKKTKIVATISDLRCDVDFVRDLYENGMNVARLNTAHQSLEDTLRVVNNIREVSDKIALLLDTKGPEIRTRLFGDKINVAEGDLVYIVNSENKDHDMQFAVTYDQFIKEVPQGSKILIDDGEIELEVESVLNNGLRCKVLNPGTLKNKKSINVPQVSFKLPSLSEKDRQYIHFAIEHDLDFIAHSFVRNKQDVLDIQEILDKHNSQVKIIAKIENHEGVENLDEILQHVYGIMVARGDLAIEIPYEKIPGIQKMIINKCIEKRKPVIIATQMLHSMIENPRPTRAEVSDIANAIYSKADAIMLSGETAYGKYPLQALKTMAKVALEVEKSRSEFHHAPEIILSTEISAHLCKSAVKAAIKLNCKAILADTGTGRTVRNLTGYRGRNIIYAMGYSQRTVRELALSFGVEAYYVDRRNQENFKRETLQLLVDKQLLTPYDRIVILGGNFGQSHGASHIEISSVENLIQVVK
jgi:pyruvate kinase